MVQMSADQITSFAKLSLLAFYRRITPFKSHNVVLYILDAMIVGNGIAHTLVRSSDIPFHHSCPLNDFQVTALSTRPIPCQYNFGAYRESCHWVLETILALSLNSAFQILIDILACTLPWVVLWKIKIGRGNRGTLFSLFPPTSLFLISITYPHPHVLIPFLRKSQSSWS